MGWKVGLMVKKKYLNKSYFNSSFFVVSLKNFNNNNGNCIRLSCEYLYICSICFGEYFKKDCYGLLELNKRIYGIFNK